MATSDQMIKMMNEISQGLTADQSSVANTPELKKKFNKLKKEMDEIIAMGGVVDFPSENPTI